MPFQEQPLLSIHTRDIWAIQKSATQVYIENSSRASLLHSEIAAIAGITLSDRHVIITNSKSINVYKINRSDELENTRMRGLQIKSTGSSFQDSDCIQIFLWDEVIIVLGNIDVKFYSLNGVLLRKLEFNDNEGTVKYLFITTHKLFTFHFQVSQSVPT